jgi:hypothetical protein
VLRLKTAAKTVFLAGLAFLLAYLVGLTPIPDSYALALAVSVALCPAALGLIGGKWLKLGPVATLAGIESIPIVMALDSRLHLGEPAGFGWLAISSAFAWAGWRLGRLPGRKS